MKAEAQPHDIWVPLDPEWLETLAAYLGSTRSPPLVKYADQIFDLLAFSEPEEGDRLFLEAARNLLMRDTVDIEVDDNAAVLKSGKEGRWVQAWVFVEEAEVTGCLECEFRGYLCPAASDGDESLAWIERCHTCETYEDDLAAAHALAVAGHDVRFAVHSNGSTRPYVHGRI